MKFAWIVVLAIICGIAVALVAVPVLSASHANQTNNPPGTRTIAGLGGSHILVFCDKATGNLIYQEDQGGTIAVVKDGCPIS